MRQFSRIFPRAQALQSATQPQSPWQFAPAAFRTAFHCDNRQLDAGQNPVARCLRAAQPLPQRRVQRALLQFDPDPPGFFLGLDREPAIGQQRGSRLANQQRTGFAREARSGKTSSRGASPPGNPALVAAVPLATSLRLFA